MTAAEYEIAERRSDPPHRAKPVDIGRRLDELGEFPEHAAEFAGDAPMLRPQPFRDIPYRIRKRDGTLRLLRLSGLPVFSPATGAFTGLS